MSLTLSGKVVRFLWGRGLVVVVTGREYNGGLEETPEGGEG